MVALLLVTHGDLGEALLASAALIVGDIERAGAISFHEGQGIEDLDEALDGQLRRLEGDGVLCLVDIPGGSPARAVAARAEEGKFEAVSGANLPMILEVLTARHHSTLSELCEMALNSGRDGVIDLGARFREAKAGLEHSRRAVNGSEGGGE